MGAGKGKTRRGKSSYLEVGYLPPLNPLFQPVEMFTRCPDCEGEEFDFIQNDEAECFDCGTRFYPDVSGSPVRGAAPTTLYHVTSAEAGEISEHGLRRDLNPHGWVYFSDEITERWARPGDAIYEVDVRGLELFHDPAGFGGDYYCEETIPAERLKLLKN